MLPFNILPSVVVGRNLFVKDCSYCLSEKKDEEEVPAKLLDDLFRKTKATPCIYWLPLTEELVNEH